MIIDIHAHAFPDKIAERAVDALRTHYGREISRGGRVDDLLAAEAGAGVSAATILVAATRPEQVRAANDWAIAQARAAVARGGQPRLIPFGTYHPGDPAWREELDRLHEAGITGIKLHPEFGRYDLEDARLDAFCAAASGRFVLLTHVGGLAANDDFSTPDKVASLARRHPGLEVVAAHMGGFRCWNRVLEVLAGARVWLDTSSSLTFIEPDLFRRLIENHGSDRILFGSDFPAASPNEELELLRGLDWLSAGDRDGILGANAARLLGLSPH